MPSHKKQSLKSAAALLGAIGGSRNTTAQKAARIENAAVARAARTIAKPGQKPTEEEISKRFMSRVVQMADEGCWIWTGGSKPEEQGAYPLFRDPRKKHPEHSIHWSFEHIRAGQAPKRGSGMQLSHQPDRCRFMSRCCNPWHVEVESTGDNNRRKNPADVAEQMANARAHKKPMKKKSHCLRGHARTPENLYSGHACKQCTLKQQAARREAIKKAKTFLALTTPALDAAVADNQKTA